MATETLSIPEERTGVLIGRNGSVKKRIEKATGTRIGIRDGIEIEGEPLDVMRAANAIRAIGRGFSPRDAMLLLREGHDLCILSLGRESRNTIKRLMGRVIGRRGATRRRIEEQSGARISVYGKTVAIIGSPDQIGCAAKCIELLIAGKTHGYAYRVLAEMRRGR